MANCSPHDYIQRCNKLSLERILRHSGRIFSFDSMSDFKKIYKDFDFKPNLFECKKQLSNYGLLTTCC